MIPQVVIEHIREAMRSMPTDHDASGTNKPTTGEIFTPGQHANALDPNTPIVVGARGTGKSFWAGVLQQPDTREVAAKAYPNLDLGSLLVEAGYVGLDDTSPAIIAARVPEGTEKQNGTLFWMAVILRAIKKATENTVYTIKELMNKYNDPEDWTTEVRNLDTELKGRNKVLLITFDALDSISTDWSRATQLLDSLFETIWSLRARSNIRAKVFIRPEQLNDNSLKFIELPKLRSSGIALEWKKTDLYGLLFSRLLLAEAPEKKYFEHLISSKISSLDFLSSKKSSPILNDELIQREVTVLLAGEYMGNNKRKGSTYNWSYDHLGDAAGKVTPRSFLKLFSEAARFHQQSSKDIQTVISSEGIRHGLREASKVRVDQLGLEYKWIKRALLPLSGLTIPSTEHGINQRWTESETITQIMKASNDSVNPFLPPFPHGKEGNHTRLLIEAMANIGIMRYRPDGRIDIPDLFRVAAKMLKRGGTTPT